MGNPLGITLPNVPEFPEEENNRQGIGKFLNDPRVVQFLLSMGLNLSQPRRQGQSELQGFSESLLAGFSGLELVREAQVAREREERGEVREAQTARNAAVVQGEQVKTAGARREGIRAETREQTRATGELVATRGTRDELRELRLGEAESSARLKRGQVTEFEQGAITRGDLLRQKLAQSKQATAQSKAAEERLIQETAQGVLDKESQQKLRLMQQQTAQLQQQTAQFNLQYNRFRLEESLKKTSDPDANLAGSIYAATFERLEGVQENLLTMGIEPGSPEAAATFANAQAQSESNRAAASQEALKSLMLNSSTNIDKIRFYAGGFEETGQVEEGKTVLRANDLFKGDPITNGPYRFGDYTDSAGNVLDAIRLETEDAVYYFILENQPPVQVQEEVAGQAPGVLDGISDIPGQVGESISSGVESALRFAGQKTGLSSVPGLLETGRKLVTGE